MRMPIRWFMINLRRYVFVKNVVLTILIVWSCYIFIKFLIYSKDFNFGSSNSLTTQPTNLLLSLRNKHLIKQTFHNNTEYKYNIHDRRIKRLSQIVKKQRILSFNNNSVEFPYYNVHIFYYAWYGNTKHDKYFNHWNHNYIPSWKKEDKTKIYRKHEAPLDIGSNYYPALGCYSSHDPDVIKTHMKQMKFAGIGVVVVSWTPPGMKDSPHDILPALFFYAHEHNIKITLHIEPYFNRNPLNLSKHLENFFEIYFNHPALYKIKTSSNTRSLPLIYVYDSYLTPFTAWKEMLSPKGNISVRGTKYDAVFIGLLVEQQHRYHIKKSHFNGFYTYFASNGFTFGSTWKNWYTLSKFARQHNLIFIPSVGPGYVDTQVRPWNSVNTRHRRRGQYFDVAWRSAISANTQYISVTSFNEWHEGTQIEPAQPKSVSGFTYLDYSPEESDFYLNLTKWWINNFYETKEKNRKHL